MARDSHAGKTPPLRGPDGDVLPDSIAEVAYVRLGGLDQWVMIRGESLANPPLILLHGGPGLSETFFFRHFNTPLERNFTVVYWDQRGSGKSFDSDIPASSMTVEQFVTDLDELVEWVRRRVGEKKVVLFGHSWGSVLGVLHAARVPDEVAAYVGSGQFGNATAGEAASYAFVLAEAERLGSRRALEQLREIGPPPYSAESLWTQRTWLNRFEGHLNAKTFWELGRIYLDTPELSVFDLPDLMRGFRFSLDAMWEEVSKIDLVKDAPALQVPVFFFLGRHDHWVPPEVSVAYYEELRAPSKQLVWFEQSGHEPFADEAAKFNSSMVELVLPVVL